PGGGRIDQGSRAKIRDRRLLGIVTAAVVEPRGLPGITSTPPKCGEPAGTPAKLGLSTHRTEESRPSEIGQFFCARPRLPDWPNAVWRRGYCRRTILQILLVDCRIRMHDCCPP